LAAFRAPFHRCGWHYFSLEAFFSGSDLGDFVADANSAPTDFGMPSVDLPCAAACIALNCAFDFAGMLPLNALQARIGFLGGARRLARPSGDDRGATLFRDAG